MTTDEGLRERKKRETRGRIQRAALRLASERGLAAVTVDDIAGAADVSQRTFFNYFPTKEAAVVGIAPELADQVAAAFEARPADEPCARSLRTVLTQMLLADAEDPGSWADKRRIIADHPDLAVAVAGATRRVQDALVAAVARRHGLTPDEHPYPRLIVGVAFAAVSTALARRRARDAGHSLLRDDLDEVFDLLEAGLPEPDRAPLTA